MTESNALTHGAHHIGLTVPDLAKTQGFFLDTLGYQQLGEVPDYPAVFLSDGSYVYVNTNYRMASARSAVRSGYRDPLLGKPEAIR